MPLDYSERRQVNRNRPQKKPVKAVFLLATATVIGIFSFGIATGWFLNKAFDRKGKAPITTAASAKPQQEQPLPPSPQQTVNSKPNDPTLTFYYTLPKGEKTALGSGLNPARPVATPRQPDSQSHSRGPTPQESGSSEVDTGKAKVDIKQEHSSGEKKLHVARNFTVQLASYSDKKEALALKKTLDNQGLFSHVVESSIPGKGTWYRVRLGNKLDQETADKIAAKVGKGAIVVPE